MDIPELAGRTAVVTGANGGIGYEIARELAAHGAHVVLACRDRERASATASRIRSAVRESSTETGVLDLSSLESVRRFTRAVRERHARVDILVNNAGLSGGPRRLTADGFEAHLGVNHLGHFALAGLLLPALLAQPGARVVTMSSVAASRMAINFADLHAAQGYRTLAAYGQSKLAGLLFAVELDRRARTAGTGLASVAAHPGVVAQSGILAGREDEWGRSRDGAETASRLFQVLLGQSAARGALPALYQATDPAVVGGSYVGPRWRLRGSPAVTRFPPAALDRDAAARLWQVSQELTGVSYAALGRPLQAW